MESPIRVLFVHQEQENWSLVVETLASRGRLFDVQEVTNRLAFARLVESDACDIVVSDCNVPGLEGMELLKFLRASSRALPVVVLAADASEEVALDFMRSGAAECVVPSTPNIQRLPQTIRGVLIRQQAWAEHSDTIEQQDRSGVLTRSILDGLPAEVALLDDRGTIVAANHAWKQFTTANTQFGCTCGLGQKYLEVCQAGLGFSAEYATMLEEALAGTRDGLRPYFVMECASMKTADERWTRLTANPLYLNQRQFIVVMHVDITNRVRAEQALRASDQQARQSRKMEVLGRLAGGVAHDFNNLLTVINGYSELMMSSLGGDDPLRSPLGEIRQAGERAARLTHQLLAFSRKQVLEPRVLDLNAAIAETGMMLRRLIGEDVEFVTLAAPDLRPILADPGQLEQIILNLAINARDAMPHSGKLTLTTQNVELDEEFLHDQPELEPGPYVLLSVRDTGCGMTDEIRAHLFEPFFTTKADGKGTGLGLAIVHGIVRQSRGHITVQSKPGRGTTFNIYLPAAANSGAAAGTVESHADPARGAETILVAEDEEWIRSLLQSALTQLGYRVLMASNGDAALAQAHDHTEPIDLLITDVVMPGMSGLVLADQIRSRRPKLKALYISGYTEDDVIRNGLPAAHAAFLQKPFTLEALSRRVRELLDAKPEPCPAGLAKGPVFASHQAWKYDQVV